MQKQKKTSNTSDQRFTPPLRKITRPLFRSPMQEGGMLSAQRLRVKPMIYKRCQVHIKEDFQVPLSPKLMKYVSYIEVFEETLAVGVEEERLQGPVKKFAAYMRKFKKVKAMALNTQHIWYESDYSMVSGAFKLLAKYFDSSALRKLNLLIDFEEDNSFAFTEIYWLHVLIKFLVKMANLEKLKIDTVNMFYGFFYCDKAVRQRLLKKLKLLGKLEALKVINGSAQMKKIEFERMCKRIPNLKHLDLDELEEDEELESDDEGYVNEDEDAEDEGDEGEENEDAGGDGEEEENEDEDAEGGEGEEENEEDDN